MEETTDGTQQVKRKISKEAEEEFVSQVGELRNKITIAEAGLERLRAHSSRKSNRLLQSYFC